MHFATCLIKALHVNWQKWIKAFTHVLCFFIDKLTDKLSKLLFCLTHNHICSPDDQCRSCSSCITCRSSRLVCGIRRLKGEEKYTSCIYESVLCLDSKRRLHALIFLLEPFPMTAMIVAITEIVEKNIQQCGDYMDYTLQ